MLFAQLWQKVEIRLFALKRRWWPDPVSELRAEATRLQAHIDETRAALADLNPLLEDLRARVDLGRRRASRLTTQVAECVKAGYESQAWPLALELEEVHRLLSDDQAELRRHEQVCWSHEFHLRQVQRKLDDIRRQLRRL
jgi:chromosome segregation ATPase